MADQPTIAHIIHRLPRLRVFDDELKFFEEQHVYKPTIPIVDKMTYLGIEIETENVTKFSRISPYWMPIEDGSLRNSGKEFITHPIRAYRVEQALHTLFNYELNPDIEFTERTSVHVHMNIRTLTVPQLEALVFTYLVFEKSLFKFIGNDRYENIFCVPLCETDMGVSLHKILEDKDLLFEWMKYTALNLLPIRQKGTIEFRHMHGTNNIERLLTWINLILCLKKFALRKSPEYIREQIASLNTTSQYRMFAEEVFGGHLHHVFNDTFNKDTSECISYVKEQCLTNEFLLQLKTQIDPDSRLAAARTRPMEIHTLGLSRNILLNWVPTPQHSEEPELDDEDYDEEEEDEDSEMDRELRAELLARRRQPEGRF